MSRRSRRGVTAIETALVIPVVLLIAFGLADWSWLMFQWHTVEASARRGVRLLMGDPEVARHADRARAEVLDHLAAFGVDPDVATVRAEVEEHPYGWVVTVSVQVEAAPLFGVGFSARPIGSAASAPWFGVLYVEEP